MRKVRVRKLKALLAAQLDASPSRSDLRQAKRAWAAFRARRPFRRNTGVAPVSITRMIWPKRTAKGGQYIIDRALRGLGRSQPPRALGHLDLQRTTRLRGLFANLLGLGQRTR